MAIKFGLAEARPLIYWALLTILATSFDKIPLLVQNYTLKNLTFD